MSNSLQPHGLQHTRLPCPSPSPRVCPSSYPLSQWCLPTISSSVTRFSSCPQSFQASGSFPRSQLFTSDGLSIGASASVLLMNIVGWFPLGLTSLISLQSKGLSRVFSSTTTQKQQFFGAQPSLWSKSHIRTWLLAKPCGSAGEESACNAGDLDSIPGSGRSPGEGKGYPLQYSGLENSMGCIVHGFAKSRTRRSDCHFHWKNHSFDYRYIIGKVMFLFLIHCQGLS